MAPLFEVVGLAMTLFIRSNEFEVSKYEPEPGILLIV